jgi:hypothetical protein
MSQRWIKGFALVTGGLAGSTLAAVAIGNLLWKRGTKNAVRRLGPDASAPAGVFSRTQLEGLPAPVVRYFDFALTPGQRLIRSARLEHRGKFRGGLDEPWSPFTSVQHFSVHPPGFVWDASIHLAPLLTVRVRDSYIGGAGEMHGKIAALVPVVNQSGGAALNAGALHRLLAEMVWLPTGLLPGLPGRGVTWTAIDDTTARATLSDSGTSVWLDFQFGGTGEIVRVSTPERYRDVEGTAVPTPWTGSFQGYQEVDGMRVPAEGEVEWILPEGRLAYWRGRVVRSEYDFGE